MSGETIVLALGLLFFLISFGLLYWQQRLNKRGARVLDDAIATEARIKALSAEVSKSIATLRATRAPEPRP